MSDGSSRSGTPLVSFVLASHNRRDVVLRTLEQIHPCDPGAEPFEIIVVDNDSTDGTAEAIEEKCHRLIRLRRNLGSCAKAIGVEEARGRFVVFLDDDSYPRRGSVKRMIEHFEADDKLGAAGFTVHLPDGRLESSALPGVFHGAGVGFRAEALRQAGNLDRTFFMQAEEYDLSFRLVNGGWRVRVFDDLHVEHLKSPQARRSDRTVFLDTRNNLRIAARYLPGRVAGIYRADWLYRYERLAVGVEQVAAFRRGRRNGRIRGLVERRFGGFQRLSPESFEFFFRWEETGRKMEELRGQGIGRVILADLGKNIYAFYRAARSCGISVAAVTDDRFGGRQRWYRGTPVLPTLEALGLSADGIVVSNMAAPFASETRDRLAGRSNLPIYCWYGAVDRNVPGESHSSRGVKVADEPCKSAAGGGARLSRAAG